MRGFEVLSPLQRLLSTQGEEAPDQLSDEQIAFLNARDERRQGQVKVLGFVGGIVATLAAIKWLMPTVPRVKQ
jgi:hypothetical protein